MLYLSVENLLSFITYLNYDIEIYDYKDISLFGKQIYHFVPSYK